MILTYFSVNGDFEQLRNSFPWDCLSTKTVVDVGGGNGHISLALARVSVYS